jgi:2-C-methyl-D-erythritol 4-phosphate cytidylyltransferase
MHATISAFSSIGSITRRQQTRFTTSSSLSMVSSPNGESVDFGDVGFVLLAGGTGSRMKANIPKQFLPLQGVPVLYHSLDLFLERLPAYAQQEGMRCAYDTFPIIFNM